MQYNTIQYRTVQYSTIQCSTIHYSTAHCSTVKFNAEQLTKDRHNKQKMDEVKNTHKDKLMLMKKFTTKYQIILFYQNNYTKTNSEAL